VIATYGVSDVEYAMREKEFIYSLNRLNVSITRARAKTIVLLPRPLIEPPTSRSKTTGSQKGSPSCRDLFSTPRGTVSRRPTTSVTARPLTLREYR
jgi:DNA replication ATP-dependent helicase Dna2